MVGGSSPVPTGPGLGIEVDEAVLREMAARTPLALPPHIPILRIPSHGVEVFGAVPPDVLGLEEGLLRGQSYETWGECSNGLRTGAVAGLSSDVCRWCRQRTMVRRSGRRLTRACGAKGTSWSPSPGCEGGVVWP